jgi:hypothetical protein
MKTIRSAVWQSSRPTRVGLLLAVTVVVQGVSSANRSDDHGQLKEPTDAHASITKPRISPRPQPQVAKSTGSLPLSFEPNEGQTDPSVDFVSHGVGYSVFLTSNEAVISQQEPDETDKLLQKMDARTRKKFEARRFYQASPRFHRREKTQTIRVAVEGANPSPNVVSSDQQPGRANYFIGRDPQQWRVGIPMYGRVQYSEIYPGIDLIYYGKRGRLEFDFVVSPGTDPNAIRLRFAGARRVSITKDGKLTVLTPQGSFELLCPEIYQVRDGRHIPVGGRFAVHRNERTVGIQVAKYDRQAQLVIDPVLTYSTYVGGNGTDYDSGVGVDAQGNAYIAGMTSSTNFPTANGYASSENSNSVAFVTKLNPIGTAVSYSTYLGGTGGDWAAGMALDPSGRVYVTGSTLSTDFPLVNAFQTSLGSPNGNAFAAVIDTTQSGTASLVYSTYLGGGGNGSNSLGDVGLAIAADASGFAYVTGQTASDSSTATFPTTSSPLQSSLASANGNAFLTVLDTTHGGPISLIYSTYLGGSSGGFGDYGLGITVDSLGNAYLTGQTTSGGSTPFPTTANAYQTTLNSQYGNVFVTEIANAQSGSGSLVYSTYLGGSSTIIVGDTGSGVGLDAAGKIYVGGDTTSADFPVTSGAFQTTNSAAGKAFVAAFDATQSGIQSLVYSTLLGGTNGSEGEVANALAVDRNGDTFVAGSTSSSDFPTSSNAYQTKLMNYSWDAFLTELDPTGAALLYSTYFGGSCSNGDLGNGVAIDPSGNAHLSGATCSSDLPTTAGAYQTTLAGTRNAFVADIPLPTSAVAIQLTPQNPTLVSGMTQQFSVIATLNNGNTQDLTDSATWVSSNPSVVTVATLPQTQGFGVGLSVGTANVTATLGTLTSSTAVTVVSGLSTPTITAVSPTSGPAGTQVTVSGSGFGATQGGGYLWLGTTLGTISSWSDSEIIATVAGISASGTVQVTQGGLQSNSVSFAVATPTVTSVSPTIGVAGTQVTIAGSEFGGTQGSGQVWLGSTSGIVNSWSNTQVVATVASGSVSGNAQILQGGVWSNSVAFAVPMAVISGITPASGGPGTSVSIAGGGFGASQGNGTVWIGGTYAAVTSWIDTQVTATVGVNAVTGVAKIQQNASWSNAMPFVVPPSQGSGPSVALFPNIIGMPVGETRSIQVLNSSNQTVSGLNWTSSDTNILTLSTDDPPLLTAVAPGNVTIFAGGASADVTVYPGPTLPVGTLQWSNPGDPSDVSQIIPAVPSAAGVDIFALEQGGNVVQALYFNGTVAWTANLFNSTNLYDPPLVTADFRGGAVVYTGSTIYSLDPTTGQPNPAYVGASQRDQSTGLGYPAVHTDGTIFTTDYCIGPQDCAGSPDSATGSWVVGIDPSSGAAKFKVPAANWNLQQTTDSYCGGSSRSYSEQIPRHLDSVMTIIAGDGYAYTTYITVDLTDVRKKAAILPFPVSAYSYFSKLLGDTDVSDFSAALNDLGALEQTTGQQFGLVETDLALGDLYDASIDEYNLAPIFRRLCDDSTTSTQKLHVLRVGSDGSSSDFVVRQWSSAQTLVYAPTPGDPYNFTQVQTGLGVTSTLNIEPEYAITNSGTGAVFSWQEVQGDYCTLATDAGCSSFLPSITNYHLTTTAGGTVTGDVIMNQVVAGQNSAVNPVLQLQNGSFVGTASGNSGSVMLNFNQSGTIRWSVPNDSPAIATVDGGLIATSGVTYDQNGNATGHLVILPTSGNIFGPSPGLPTYTWTGNVYEIALGSVAEVGDTPFGNATPPFWSFSGANPSGNGTSPVCRDIRDSYVAEYGSTVVDDRLIHDRASWPRFTPTCLLFTNSASSQNFPFQQINVPDPGTHPEFSGQYALIKRPLVVSASSGYGLDAWVQNYKSSRIIDSGYRDPNQNTNPNSRHMLGDAIDLQNQTCPQRSAQCSAAGQAEWQRMVDAATQAHADWIEPVILKKGVLACNYACVHAEWPLHDHGNYAVPERH